MFKMLPPPLRQSASHATGQNQQSNHISHSEVPLRAYRSLATKPIIKSSNLLLSVAKDLANQWTDMVLLYSEAFIGPGMVLSYFTFYKKDFV